MQMFLNSKKAFKNNQRIFRSPSETTLNQLKTRWCRIKGFRSTATLTRQERGTCSNSLVRIFLPLLSRKGSALPNLTLVFWALKICHKIIIRSKKELLKLRGQLWIKIRITRAIDCCPHPYWNSLCSHHLWVSETELNLNKSESPRFKKMKCLSNNRCTVTFRLTNQSRKETLRSREFRKVLTITT